MRNFQTSTSGICGLRLLASLALLAFAPVVYAQTYTPPAEDAQLGLTALPCTNTNTAFAVVNWVDGSGVTHKVFCTPSGHVLPMTRGFFGMDLNLIGGSDESGHTTNFYESAKYGSTATWAAQQVAILKKIGGNSLPTYANSNVLPMANSNKAPFVVFEIMSAYSLINKLGWGTGPVKEVYSFLSPQWGGFTRNGNGDGIADYRDPNWTGMIDGVLTNSPGSQALASAPTATKNLLLGFSFDDSDTTHGFGASKDFTTRPASGNNDFQYGYLAYFAAPMQTANRVQAEIYSDETVYFKKRWHDLMTAEYASIGAMNTAIGSSYTSFGTSGVCVGSHLPSYITPCGSTAAADSLGTGNGSTTTFSGTLSHTNITGLSFGIFVNGVLVAGDQSNGAKGGGCTGTLYGPTITAGTLNCTTGAWSVTFSSAPFVTAPITGEYISGGWGQGGTGLLDEDCRAGHSSYCGNGSGNTTVFLTGLNASAIADINSYSKDIAQFYSSTINAHLQTWGGTHGFTGHIPYLGPTTLGTWGTPPNAPILQGMCGNVDAWMYGGSNVFSQAEIDYVHTNATCGTDFALINGEYQPAGAQSEQAWPGSTATGSVGVGATTVTVTVATPNKVSALGTSVLYDLTCTDTTYNKTNFHPTAPGATTFTYTSVGSLASSPTTCNFWPDDSQVGGFATQAAKGAAYVTDAGSMFTLKYTANNVAPYLGIYSWEWYNDWSDQHAWGPRTIRGNMIDGVSDVQAVVTCPAPDAAFNCGGELSVHQPPYGNFVGSFITAMTNLDNDFLGGAGAPAVSLSTSSVNFGTAALNSPDSGCNVGTPCVVTLTNSGTATLNITSIALVTGTNYSVSGTTCGSTLAQAASCNITLQFLPIALGVQNDTLRFTTNASTSPDNVSVTGQGVIPTAPALQIVFQPLPAQPPIPTLTGIKPQNTYATSNGFSQDGKTFVQSLAVTLTGTNLLSTTQCSFDGTNLPCSCSATQCTMSLPWTAAMAVTKNTIHQFSVTNPAVPVSVLQ